MSSPDASTPVSTQAYDQSQQSEPPQPTKRQRTGEARWGGCSGRDWYRGWYIITDGARERFQGGRFTVGVLLVIDATVLDVGVGDKGAA